MIDTIIEHAKKDIEGRKAFIADAGRVISHAVESQMMRDGRLTELMSPEAKAERVESETSRTWVETKDWISRVVGIAKWQATDIDGMESSGTNWLPDTVDAKLGELLALLPAEELAEIIERLNRALIEGVPSISHELGEIPATVPVIEALSRRLAEFLRLQEPDDPSVSLESYLPVTHDNFWEVDFKAEIRQRGDDFDGGIPSEVKSLLQPHQVAAHAWQVEAWRQGLPGILNADEQGLGKTLQTLSFITWLKQQMAQGKLASRPILVVAPTSLLLNWEAEIERHIHEGELGTPIRLYGDHLAEFKKEGASGQDIRQGDAQLDTDALLRREGGSPIIITTYQTLANYAISLMELPCAVAVFDEIQFLKNPVTMRARAAKSLRADFRIGLTGTPIENATKDLWALMDQLFPGALGARDQFRRIFDRPTEENMAVLHTALFRSQGGRPQLALRRLKTDAAPHLPTKVRILHPREMPAAQMLRYDEARMKGGMMLALLHHIRRVSLHPGLIEGETPDEFSAASARVAAALDILRHIKAKNERALVFVENRDIQAWFAELVRLEFGLERVLVINGDTTVDARKSITDRFQRHLQEDKGFDVLVLGPRAAGTGLTLTAANHVIHLSRWWNPAVEEQCNDRTHRIGQTKPVTVHIPLAVHPQLGRGSFDCLLQLLMKRKRSLAERILWPAEASPDETKLLYDAVISAGANPQVEASTEFTGVFEGRSDLAAEFISAATVRVGLRGGGATVVVSNDTDVPVRQLKPDSDAVLVTINPKAGGNAQVPLPHSRLSAATLWPEFILPD
ncbi:DEAD/DEAH box helicase [Phyllobacterium sophorae]|uniref:DEAD/DEAH box helicase n=1 Tax=Phyllobacterium sophorae TaxID=1520277 RepID=UPI001473FF78|nr:DEAD/DEAH box helicase [Phyllobacterium sophorae]